MKDAVLYFRYFWIIISAEPSAPIAQWIRVMVFGTSDGGSNPPGGTLFVIIM